MNHWCLNAFQRTSIPDFLDALRQVFPLLYAVDDGTADVRNLSEPDDAYHVLYQHLVNFRYMTLVGGFLEEQVEPLLGDLAMAVEQDVAVAEQAAAVPALDGPAHRTEAQRDAALAELALMRGSRSWRLTRPLRRLRGGS